MKKTLILIFILGLQAAWSQELTIVGRIEEHGDALKIIRSLEGDVLPGMLQNKELEKDIALLQKGDEVLLKGHIAYQAFSVEKTAQHKPIFVVHSIKAISLSKLGAMENMMVQDPMNVGPIEKSYSPLVIPVTTEVASAITLTSSVLLLQSLTATHNEPQISRDINTGMIVFAGVMATGIFIYDQISTHKLKGKQND